MPGVMKASLIKVTRPLDTAVSRENSYGGCSAAVSTGHPYTQPSVTTRDYVWLLAGICNNRGDALTGSFIYLITGFNRGK